MFFEEKKLQLKFNNNNNNIWFYFLTSGREWALHACDKINGHYASQPPHCPAGYN